MLLFQDNLQNRKFCPVGKLLPGVGVVILNDQLQAQPLGVAGEVSYRHSKLLLNCQYVGVAAL